MEFAHPNQAQVRKIRHALLILSRQRSNLLEVSVEVKCNFQEAVMHKIENLLYGPYLESGLTDY